MELNEKERRAVSMGPIVRMRVYEKKTRRPVFMGFFQPPHMVDATYFDKEEMLDPTRSDLPVMMKLVALGYFSPPEVGYDADYMHYTWRAVTPPPR